MYSDAPRLTRAGLRSGGALSRAKDNITSRVCTTLAAALASPRPDGAYPARLHCYSHIQRSRLSGRPCKAVRATGTWPLMVARWSVRVFSFLFFSVESRSSHDRSVPSHGPFYHRSNTGHSLVVSCVIRVTSGIAYAIRGITAEAGAIGRGIASVAMPGATRGAGVRWGRDCGGTRL